MNWIITICITTAISITHFMNRKSEIWWPLFSWTANNQNHSDPKEINTLSHELQFDLCKLIVNVIYNSVANNLVEAEAYCPDTHPSKLIINAKTYLSIPFLIKSESRIMLPSPSYISWM